MTAADRAIERAQHLLASTSLFRELGLDELAADSRAVARLAVDLADRLDAERSARVALQERLAVLEKLVAGSAYYLAMAEAKSIAERATLTKRHLASLPATPEIEWPTKGERP